MTKQELAQQIKAKYPQYANVDDVELADKMIAKYHVYADKITAQDKWYQKDGQFSLGKSVDKVTDFVVGGTKDLAKLAGEGMASYYVTAPEVQRQQQMQQAQDDIIISKMKEAREAGNMQEYERLKGLLATGIRTLNADEVTQDFSEKRNKSIKSTVRALGETLALGAGPVKGATAGARIAGAAGRGAGFGSASGFGMSDAQLIGADDKLNLGQVGKAATDTAIGGAIGGVVGAGVQGLSEGIGALGRKMVANKATKAKATQAGKQMVEKKPFEGSVIDDKAVDRTYQELPQKERVKIRRQIQDYFVDNDISVSSQQAKQLRPEKTMYEINKQLKAAGKDLPTTDIDELSALSQYVTGENGATTRTTRDIIASNSKPLKVDIKEGDKYIDPITRNIKEAIGSSSEVKFDKKLSNSIIKEITAILDDAKIDMNYYDPVKLYDAQRQIEKFAATQRAINNRPQVGAQTGKSIDMQKIYESVSKEIANIIDNTSVDDGIFYAARDSLADEYAQAGLMRLADQTRQAKNVSQLRSTAAPFVNLGKILEVGEASRFSTFNKNTAQVNKLLGKLSPQNPVRMIGEAVDVFVPNATRNVGYGLQNIQKGAGKIASNIALKGQKVAQAAVQTTAKTVKPLSKAISRAAPISSMMASQSNTPVWDALTKRLPSATERVK